MALITDSLGKNSVGAQYKLVGGGTADVTALGAASDDVVLCSLPGGAVITAVHTNITTLFDGTTPTLVPEVLNLDGSDLTVAIAFTAVTATAVGTTTQVSAEDALAAPCYLTVKNTAADSTVGEATVYVEYFIVGRANENAG